MIIPPIQGFAIGLNALQSAEPTSPARLQRQHYSGNARALDMVYTLLDVAMKNFREL